MDKLVASNRRAHHDYTILETIEAGIDPNDVRASNIGPIFWSKDNLEKGLTNSIS